jgi:hypothetical protein
MSETVFVQRVLYRFALEAGAKSWLDCCEETDGHFLVDDMEFLVEIAANVVADEIEKMKIDILGGCAYQGADLPKKWLREEVPKFQMRNKTLEELRCFLQKKYAEK